MRVELKVGTKEGFVSSYNLFFPDGLRLQTEDLTWKTADEKETIRSQFYAVVEVLRAAGWTVVEKESK